MTWTTDWSVSVGGTPMTDGMRPYLQSIRVTDKAGSASDSCSLTFDDTAGQIRLPQPGSSVAVSLNGVPVFRGVSEVPKSRGGRGAGRTLQVSAKGFDVRGKAKEPQLMHQDDGSIGDFLKKLGEKAGFNTDVDPALRNIMRDYIVADGESFLYMGEKLARELGGTFKLRGKDAVLTKLGGEFGLPEISGLFGQGGLSGNLISWDIEPLSSSEIFGEVAVRYFDRPSGEIRTQRSQSDAEQTSPALYLVRSVARDESHAREIAEGRTREIEREGGAGSVTLDLTPSAQAEALFHLTGTRSGVDGTYRIVSVTHQASRSGGATTTLKLKQPQGGAGQDTR